MYLRHPKLLRCSSMDVDLEGSSEPLWPVRRRIYRSHNTFFTFAAYHHVGSNEMDGILS